GRARALHAGVERRSSRQAGRDGAALRGAAPADPRTPAPDQPGAQRRAGCANPERGSGEAADERAAAEPAQVAGCQSGRGSGNAGLPDAGAAGPLSGGAAPVPGTPSRVGPASPRAAAALAGTASAPAAAATVTEPRVAERADG